MIGRSKQVAVVFEKTRTRRRRCYEAKRTFSSHLDESLLILKAEKEWSNRFTCMKKVQKRIGQELLDKGFCVLENAFSKEYTALLRREMLDLYENGKLYCNSTHILLQEEAKPILLEKKKVMETELIFDGIQQEAPVLKRFFESQMMYNAIKYEITEIGPIGLTLENFMIKLQLNEGNGGCFPLHFDTYGDDGKCITAILYLNDEWQKGDGGELVVYPFPKEKVVIPPREGTVVLFSSQQMLHRVLPSSKQRFCLTTWIYGSNSKVPKVSSLMDLDPLHNMLSKIFRSPFRRHLQKLYYQDEWTQSLVESHRDTAAFRRYLETQQKELKMIEVATNRMLENFQAKTSSPLPRTSEELLNQIMVQNPQKLKEQIKLEWF